MTGFGKAVGEVNLKKINVEIKSLNSKQADISVRMPSFYKEKELPLRSLINQQLVRGKIEFNLYVELQNEQKGLTLNKELFKKYFDDFKDLEGELNQSLTKDITELIAKLPDVLKADKEELEEKEWIEIQKVIEKAINQIDQFRIAEGKALEKELLARIANISSLLKKVDKFDENRIENIKKRIDNHLKNIVGEEQINKDRFEQELIFYIEKLDVSEEKLRLSTHLDYFVETINTQQSEGKKMGFIGQEMGREINTLGSKANNAEMQKIVVQMKDELEKIKEQVLNVL